MSGVVHVEELVIRAFRGIRDELRLPLDARLTLIEAPNGTGKSTICEAAEWLLTGSLERLDGSENALRSRFAASETRTSVEALVRVDGAPLRLARQLDNPARWMLQDGEARARQSGVGDVVARLAPGAAEQAGRTATETRSLWMKGNRFLSSVSLARLLDPESVDGRRQLFADLLGVRHLLDVQKRLIAVASELARDIRRGEVELATLDREMSGLAAEMRVDAAGALEAVEAEIHSLLGNDELGKTRDEPLIAALAHHRVELREQRRRLDVRRRAGLLVSSEAEVLDGVRRRREELRSELARRTEAQAALREEEARLALASRFAAARTRLAAAECAWRELLDHRDRSGDAEALPRPDPRGRERIALLAAECRTFEEARAAHTEAELSLSEASSRAPDTATMVLLANARDRTAAHLAEVNRRYAGAVGPIRALQAAVRNAMRLVGSDAHCPACRHDWGQHEALLEALQAGSVATPLALDVLVREQALATEDAAAAERAWSAAADLQRHVEHLKQVHSRTAERWGAMAERIRQEGADPDAGDLAESLRQARWRLDAADAREELERGCDDAAAALEAARSRGVALVDLARGFLADLDEKLAISPQDVSRQQLVSEQQRDGATALELLDAERRACDQRLAAFDEAWQEFATGDQPLGERARIDAELAAQNARLDSEESRLAKLEELARIREELQGQDPLRRRISAMKVKHATRQGEIEGLKARHDALVAVAALYKERQLAWSAAQLSGILDVASPLYCRSQANELVQAIRSDEHTEPFLWLADIGGDVEALAPDAHFSQGQRQDLALALFLARARGVGGTFFLDEPASHLDDLNRVALLDILRMLAVERDTNVSLVVTTASRALVRHLVEKLHAARSPDGRPVLRVIALGGNPRFGVAARLEWPGKVYGAGDQP